jgi:predicted GNAT superfamily acetyltransferase
MTDESVIVRLAGLDDLKAISHPYLKPDKVAQKIGRGEIFLLLEKEQQIGSLWANFFWDSIPFIDLIIIDAAHRGRGLSRVLLEFFEDHLRQQGYTVLYSSSQLDEPQAQTWHRHIGFEECGFLNGLNQGGIGEVFFRKDL